MQSSSSIALQYDFWVCESDEKERLLRSLPENNKVREAFDISWNVVNDPRKSKIICCVSGGSDSDLIMHIISAVDRDNKVTFVYSDPGLEYTAIKEHLDFLETRYCRKIIRMKPQISVPEISRIEGPVWINKRVSENIQRLQLHHFEFENDTYENLIKKYPHCSSALKWWCNDNPGMVDHRGIFRESRMNISWNHGLKEFILANNGLDMKISNRCASCAKLNGVRQVCKEMGGSDIMITGVRVCEGGYRSVSYKSVYEAKTGDFRPILFFNNNDKEEFNREFNIVNATCYKYLKRTGCALCPCMLPSSLGREIDYLKANDYELYDKAVQVFGQSHELAEKYHEFVKKM